MQTPSASHVDSANTAAGTDEDALTLAEHELSLGPIVEEQLITGQLTDEDQDA